MKKTEVFYLRFTGQIKAFLRKKNKVLSFFQL